jgi:hypothetical protein
MLLPIGQAFVGYGQKTVLVSRSNVPFRVNRLYVEQQSACHFRLHGLRIKKRGEEGFDNKWPNEGMVSALLYSDRVYEPPSMGLLELDAYDELHLEVENIAANTQVFAGVWQGDQRRVPLGVDAKLAAMVREPLPHPFLGWHDPASWRFLGNVDTRAHKTFSVLEHEYAGSVSREVTGEVMFYALVSLNGAEQWQEALRARPDEAVILRDDEWDCIRDHFRG